MNTNISIKLSKNGKRIYSFTSTKRALIADRLRTLKWDKGYIKVSYGNDHYNDGDYDNLKDMKWALTTFTEKDLVDYLQGDI